MAVDRSQTVDENFQRLCREWEGASQGRTDLDEPVVSGFSLDGRTLIELLDSQIKSRHLDLQARVLKRRDLGYYTIGSSGHEGNVVLGRLVRHTDPAFLHYRSSALMIERARQVAGTTPIFDQLLSYVASKEDPASGGRHKVFGSRLLWVPPQTSTIASQLPKAVGCAFALERAGRLDVEVPLPEDAIVLCSFGDASVNHATAQTAFNAASWTAFQNLPMPILFVCEDNGLGISVRTPRNWIAARMKDMPGIRYFRGDGTFLPSAWDAAREAVTFCRRTRQPAFLHLEVARLLGHAGTDVETVYLGKQDILAAESRDPLLWSARLVLERGLLEPEELLERYESVRRRVAAAAVEAAGRPKLTTAAEVMEPLAPRHDDLIMREARRTDYHAERVRIFGGEEHLPERETRRRHMAVQINRALADLLAKCPEMIVFGEDVAGRKGGVYGVTAGLTQRAGLPRVFNTLLDETTILGVAIGAAHLGFLPVPEIQYLAYYHNAEDQIRGEAGSLSFFSAGAFRNPMVVRIASFGYQKGFGGHFHNDNSIAALRDVPGLIIAVPSRGDEAVRLLRTCVAAARVDGRVVMFLEPIARYMTRDLHEKGDGLYETLYPPPGDAAPLGEGRVVLESPDDVLTIITYANGVYLSLRAARELEQEHGLRARIVDLRWILPMDARLIREQARATGRVLIVDEGRRTGGVAEQIATVLSEDSRDEPLPLMRVTGEDTYIPLGPAADTVLPQEADIVRGALRLCADLKPAGGQRS